MFDKLKNRIRNLLIWSQGYTKTDMIYLAKGGFWLSLGQFIITGSSFLLTIAFANLLDPVVYGNYKYIISIVGLLGISSLTGMGSAIMRATAQKMEGSFYSGFETKLRWSLLGSLVAIGGAIYYWLRGNELLPIPLLISAIFLPLMQASSIYNHFLQGKKLFNLQVKYNILNQLIPAGAIISTLFITKNLFWLMAIYFISHTFSNYFFYLLTKHKFHPSKKEDSQTIPYGKHLSVVSIINTAASHFDGILVFHWLGAIELAIYQFAIQPIEQIMALLGKIQTLAIPKFSQKNRNDINKNIFPKILKLFLFSSAIAVIYIACAPLIYKSLFPRYIESISYSQIFAISLISVPVFLVTSIFQSQKMIREIYWLNISRGIIQIITTIVLISFFGLMGAVISKILTRLLNLIISLLLLIKSKG